MKAKISMCLLTMLLVMLNSCQKDEKEKPYACFTYSGDLYVGETITFSASCSEMAVSYEWDFGDGNTSTEESPQNIFEDEGSYIVTLTVTHENGESDTQEQTIDIAQLSSMEHSGKITADETWAADVIHIITGDVYVENATLTIEPGAIVKFQEGTSLKVGYSESGGTLIADGTETDSITFTSYAAQKTDGDWDYIGFYSGASSSSSMKYCIVEYGGGYSSTRGAIYIDESHITIENCAIRYSENIGISLENESYFESFIDNKLTDLGSYPISIYGNYVYTIGEGNSFSTTLGVQVKGDWVETESPTWIKLDCPYIIAGDLYVGSTAGTVFTLEPGITIALANGVKINVGYSDNLATLIAEGTEEEEITFTSAATNKTDGDWDFVRFNSGTTQSTSLKYCTFEYGGGYSSSKGCLVLDESYISIENCTITNSENYGISLDENSYFISFTNNTVSNTGSEAISIYANWVQTIGADNSFDSTSNVLVSSDYITETGDLTWRKLDCPYLIAGDLYVGSTSGTNLIIEEGSTLLFASGVQLKIGYSSNATLVAKGTATNKITFSSAAGENSAAGDWDGIKFYSSTNSGTILDYCVVEYGGGYSTFNTGNIVVDGTSNVTISNSEINYSAVYGIFIESDASATLSNNTFSDNSSGDTN